MALNHRKTEIELNR
jgi:hypothetical protein